MTMVVGPRIIERAKIASLMNLCNQIRTSCVGFMTKNIVKSRASLPPAYGYKDSRTSDNVWQPYMKQIEYFHNQDLYDPFSTSHDTDHDGILSPLEFSPIGVKTGPDTFTLPTELYKWSDALNHRLSPVLQDEVNRQMGEKRPLVYVPVNADQAKRVAKSYNLVRKSPSRIREGWYAERWLPNETFAGTTNPLSSPAPLAFPPVRYDDFVLISVGPGASTGGILQIPDRFLKDLNDNGIPEEDWYHIFALRAYFLATRDANDNGMLDFDFRSRTQQGEGKPQAYANQDPAGTLLLNQLPDGTNGQGAIIYQYSGA
jgi:hypothetical protein